MIPKFTTNFVCAVDLDESDPLAHFRHRFFNPDPDMIYLDGNSLGRLPLQSIKKLNDVIQEEWGAGLIKSWNRGWYHRAAETGKKISGIIGAKGNEVIVSDSTSLNLYKLAFAATRLRPGRTKIVSDEFNFPTDLYILQGIINNLGAGYHLELIPSHDGITVDMDTISKYVDTDTALVVLSHVAFKSAFMYDMKSVTKLVHDRGALMLWDLSHAAGAVPVELNACGADLAIGCSYKYLNGGPGAPAFLYVREDIQDLTESPIWGWFGESNPFAFNLEYKPAKGINRFLVGTPPVLSLSGIDQGVDLLLEAGIHNIRNKSILQTEYLLFLVREYLFPLGFTIGSPEDWHIRGSHVSLRHPEGYRICEALIHPQKGEIAVIPDFREPDNIRLGIAPLYNSFMDIHFAVQRILNITSDKTYERYTADRRDVT